MGRGTSIRAGDGSNEISIQDGDFSGAVSIVTGSQSDSIVLDTDATAAGVATFFRVRLTVRTGAGSDGVQVGHILGNDEVHCLGASLFDGGGDLDGLSIWGRGNVFDVSPVIRNFETVS